MSLVFSGVAHPPAKTPRDHPSDLSAGEMLTTQLGGLPIHMEHETASRPVGNCLASWPGQRGELRVMGQITDSNIAQQVKDGSLRGLSLGTDCIQSMSGETLSRAQRELSVCEEGRRNGTWITHIDNHPVHQVAAFSNKRNGACFLFELSACLTLTCDNPYRLASTLKNKTLSRVDKCNG